MSGRPPSWCKTLAVCERIRVPSPAARTSTSSGAWVSCGFDCVCLSMFSELEDGVRADARLFAAGDNHTRQFFGTVAHLLAFIQKVCANNLRLIAEFRFEPVVSH